jgi:hypothetical protein
MQKSTSACSRSNDIGNSNQDGRIQAEYGNGRGERPQLNHRFHLRCSAFDHDSALYAARDSQMYVSTCRCIGKRSPGTLARGTGQFMQSWISGP